MNETLKLLNELAGTRERVIESVYLDGAEAWELPYAQLFMRCKLESSGQGASKLDYVINQEVFGVSPADLYSNPDILKYRKFGVFNNEQLVQLAAGVRDDLNVAEYAIASIDAEKMCEWRAYKTVQFHVAPTTIALRARKYLNVVEYMEKNESFDYMKEMPFNLDHAYACIRAAEIQKWEEAKIPNIEWWNKPWYNHAQLKVIRHAIKAKLNAEELFNHTMTVEEMVSVYREAMATKPTLKSE